MLRMGERRLIVNLDDLRDYNRVYCDGSALVDEQREHTELTSRLHRLLKTPMDYLPAFNLALKEIVSSVYEPGKHKLSGPVYIGARASATFSGESRLMDLFKACAARSATTTSTRGLSVAR